MGALSGLWKRTDTWILVMVLLCGPWAVGGVLLGWHGEELGWWDNRPVITNLYSSFVSALVGLPLAVLLVTSLTSRHEETAARTAAFRRAAQTARLFREALLGKFPTGTPEMAGTQLRELQAACRVLRHATNSERGLARVPGSSHLGGEVVAINEALERAFVAEARSSQQMQWFAELRTYWRLLDTEVEPYLDELGLSPEQPVQIADALKQLTADPPAPFLQLTGGLTVRPLKLRQQALAMINGATALLYLLDQVDDLERIEQYARTGGHH
ncbi:hypothetical protein [Streptomyces sp.]|uniref:hypothetical protein n=1 Tax=Streptomyces sp. TaxID=1931 RepID=UPI002F920398